MEIVVASGLGLYWTKTHQNEFLPAVLKIDPINVIDTYSLF
jgi:hypothetical protein